jgi:hypothetical protein
MHVSYFYRCYESPRCQGKPRVRVFLFRVLRRRILGDAGLIGYFHLSSQYASVRLLCLLAVAVLAPLSLVEAQTTQTFDGRVYYIYTASADFRNFTGAHARAATTTYRGVTARLLTIRSQAEQDFMNGKTGLTVFTFCQFKPSGSLPVWIGATDLVQEGLFD